MFASQARRLILKRKLRLSPRNKDLDIDLDLISRNIDFGDWKLLYHLLR